MTTPSHSESLQWEKIGKVANWAKLAILSHSEPLWWEKIGKVVNRAKLAIPSHSESLQWEKIQKVANQAKLAILSHSEPLWWEKIGKVVNQNVTLTQNLAFLFLWWCGEWYIAKNQNVILIQNSI